jgi:iron complex outermembrane receptor protein
MSLFRLSLLLIIFTAQTLWAQTPSDVVDVEQELKVEVKEKIKSDQDETPRTKNTERIEVSGSYVRRIDVEGPTPVITYDQKDFNNAGVDTVNDFLKESPLFEGSDDSGNNDGAFRFRGQHAGSTLVLINGMRIPKLGGADRGFYNGVEAIPTNVIERVEIVKDGSSALYGSDAMAGVMNFITKKDYDGAEYSTRVNVPEINRGIQQNHSIAFGKSYSNASWFATAQFVEQRGYHEADIRNFFPDSSRVLDTRSTVRLNTYSDPNAKDLVSGREVGRSCPDNSNEDCQIDTRHMDYVREPRQNIGTMLTGTIDISSDMSLNMMGLYNRRNRRDLGRPDFINLNGSTGRVLQTSQLSPGLQAQANGAPYATLEMQPNDEVGLRQIDVLQNAYAAQMQLQKYFGETWKWELGGSYGYSLEERTHRNGVLNLDIVQNAFQSGLNPMSLSPSNAGSLTGASVNGAVEAYESSLATARFITTGEVFDFGRLYGLGGPFSVAVGLEGQWESTADVHDAILLQPIYSRQFLNESGDRNIGSVFAEMVMYPLDSLEVQLAGRLDNYSDWGNTFNPKVALGYRPSNKVLFRGSWGTNFNAPSLRNMIAAEVVEYQNLEFNAAADREFGVPSTRYRDPNLRPETGMNYNFGTVIQPNKNWTFTIDQWNFEGQDTLTRFFARDYNRAYAEFLNSPNPDQAMQDIGVTINRAPDGSVTSVRMPHVFNMGNRTIRGLDLGTRFNSPIRLIGRVLQFGMSFDHTQMFVYRTQSLATLPAAFRQDLEWKNTLSFDLATKTHTYRLAARTLSGSTDQFSTRTHTEYDFNYTWALPWWDGRLQAGVKNILNTDTPVRRDLAMIDFNSGFATDEFNPLGRRYYVGYSQSF